MTSENGRSSERPVGLDEALTALSHATRRRILVELLTDNPRRQQEFETVAFGPGDADEEIVTARLHHTHLPKLDEAGFIEWERETGTITRGEKFEVVRSLLELMDDNEAELPGDWP